MPRTVNEITKALKLKAEPKRDALTIRIGVKKLVLPFEVRTLSSEGYIFVHIPPSAGILKVTNEGLRTVEQVSDAQEAVASFRKSNRRGSRRNQKVQMPQSLLAALKDLPSGYKLAYEVDGKPKLVKTRKRGKV